MNNKHIGSSLDSFLQEVLTPEENTMLANKANFELELTQCRKSKNITQQVLSKKTGISQGTIAKIELGTTNPTLNNVFKILTALGKTISITDIPGK